MLPDAFYFMLKEIDALMDKAAIGFQLCLTGTSGADATAKSL
jgi:hypothetical protein